MFSTFAATLLCLLYALCLVTPWQLGKNIHRKEQKKLKFTPQSVLVFIFFCDILIARDYKAQKKNKNSNIQWYFNGLKMKKSCKRKLCFVVVDNLQAK